MPHPTMHVPYNALLISRLLLGYQARLLYWGWKNVLNSTSCKYLLLAEFDVRTVSYGPSLFCSIYGSSGSSAKNEDTWFTVSVSRERCLSYFSNRRKWKPFKLKLNKLICLTCVNEMKRASFIVLSMRSFEIVTSISISTTGTRIWLRNKGILG